MLNFRLVFILKYESSHYFHCGGASDTNLVNVITLLVFTH
jgi:hypothetical protein